MIKTKIPGKEPEINLALQGLQVGGPTVQKPADNKKNKSRRTPRPKKKKNH